MHVDPLCRAKDESHYCKTAFVLARQLWCMYAHWPACVMHKWGMWELFSMTFLYKTRLLRGVVDRGLHQVAARLEGTSWFQLNTKTSQQLNPGETLWLNVPVRKRRTSVPVPRCLPGKSGRSHTVGPDPAETESTGRMHPGLDLWRRSRGEVSRPYKRIKEAGLLTVSLRLPPVALLRGVLLLTEGLLLAGALLILGLLLAVLGIT